MKERAALLKIILEVISEPKMSGVTKDLLKDGVLETNLVKSLHRNLQMMEVYVGFTCSLKEVNSYLQREELLILAILAHLYRNQETPKVSQLVDFLSYQQKTRF